MYCQCMQNIWLYYTVAIIYGVLFIHIHAAAKDKGNNMLTYYHPGIYGSPLKNQWGCCKNSERTYKGCQSIHHSICMYLSNVLNLK